MTKKFKIIVTGATGFVGKILIKKLAKKYGGNNIFCLIYNNETGSELTGQKLLDKLKITYKKVDLTDYNSLRDLPKGAKTIIHLAAQTDTSRSDHSVNDLGVINLYKALGKLNKTTHFIHVGTMVEVVGRKNCKIPIDENTTDYPTNEYTRTKLRGEKYLVKKCKEDNFKLTVIRPNTIYGKNYRKNTLFDMVVSMIKSGSVITRINWPGRAALIHIEDITDIIMFFTKSNTTPGKPQKFFAYAENLSIFELSQIIHHKLGVVFNPIILPPFIWSILRNFRVFIPNLEKLLPNGLYNYFWRLGIIVDDVVWCKSDKLFKNFTSFRPKLFKDMVKDVV